MGTRPARFSMAERSSSPKFCSSKHFLNSLATGSPASLATVPMAELRLWPARNALTIMSNELGSFSSKLSNRRLRLYRTYKMGAIVATKPSKFENRFSWVRQ